MKSPKLSLKAKKLELSAIRLAQIKFAERKDNVKAVNASIGNVSLPTHPAIINRLKNIHDEDLQKGIIKYTASCGLKETQDSFLKIIKAICKVDTDNLNIIVTNGASEAIKLSIYATCGKNSPLLLAEPSYANHIGIAYELDVPIISVRKKLLENGTFTLPKITEIEKIIKKKNPGALIITPYDNPTGTIIPFEDMLALAKLCVKYNMWFVSDEAYRGLEYQSNNKNSIWKINNTLVKGIENRRISLETSSKVFNGCGLRLGALVSDNQELYQKALANYTIYLCAGAIDQYVFGAVASLSEEEILSWIDKLKKHYCKIIMETREKIINLLPNIIISKPEAAIYSVIDVKNISKGKNFDAKEFCIWCAITGKEKIGEIYYTLLLSPMDGFYVNKKDKVYKTQMRISYVADIKDIEKIPILLKNLLEKYLKEIN